MDSNQCAGVKLHTVLADIITVKGYTVDLVIFASLNFREFMVLGLVTKFIIREFSFSFSGAIIKIIFEKFALIKTSRNMIIVDLKLWIAVAKLNWVNFFFT